MRALHSVRLALVASGLALVATAADAQQAYVYPMKGQSQEQQSRDRGDCSNWATQQTGYSPYQAQGASAVPRGGMLRGAAGGAAIGAMGGAIGGDAGKGAAIGAGVGALFGGVRSRRLREEEQYRAQQMHAAYMRAFGACMEGRGYAVK